MSCSSLRAAGHDTERWSVYRRYLEFYVLESKLTEFHGKTVTLPNVLWRFCECRLRAQSHLNCFTGTFADAQLPSKRIIGPKNYEFLTSKRGEFEEYLQVFSQDSNSRTCGSEQLLHFFYCCCVHVKISLRSRRDHYKNTMNIKYFILLNNQSQVVGFTVFTTATTTTTLWLCP